MDELAIKFNEDATKIQHTKFIEKIMSLQDGQEFNNWKEFMAFMEEPYINDRQLKSFRDKTEYYAIVEKSSGHKFKLYPIRDQKFRIPLPTESKELSLLVQAVLISVIRHNIRIHGQQNIQCSKKALALACGMVGSQFYMYANQQGRLKHEITKELDECHQTDLQNSPESQRKLSCLINEYYESMLNKLTYHTISSVKSLSKKDLLLFEEVYFVIEREEEVREKKHNTFGDAEDFGEIVYRPGKIRKATNKEQQQRLAIYQKVLNEMGYSSVLALPESLRMKYYNMKTERANSEMKIWGFFKGYNINTVKDIEYDFQHIMNKIALISDEYYVKGEESLETAKKQVRNKFNQSFHLEKVMEEACDLILDKTLFADNNSNYRDTIATKYYNLGLLCGSVEDDDDLDSKLK